MKTIYIAEVMHADDMTKSSKNVLNYINGKYYAVGNKDDEDDYCRIWDNCGRGWWVDSNTIVKLPIDEEITGTCEDCKYFVKRHAYDTIGECTKDIIDGFTVGAVYNYDNMFLPEDFGCIKFESK